MARLMVAEVTAEVGRKLAEVRRSEDPPYPPAQASASAPLPRAGAGLRRTSEATTGRVLWTYQRRRNFRIQAMVDGLDQLAMQWSCTWAAVDRLRLLVSVPASEQVRTSRRIASTNGDGHEHEAFVRAQAEGMLSDWSRTLHAQVR